MVEENEILSKILRYSDPYAALEESVRVRRDGLSIGNDFYLTKHPLIVSLGKASHKMAKWAIEKFENAKVVSVSLGEKTPGVENILSTHPNVSENSVRAALRISELINSDDYDLLLFLISGGASAMVENPAIPLEDYIRINYRLIRSGLDIWKINTVRKHLSLVKGGRMFSSTKKQVVSLIVSDVPGDDVSTIGGGITAPDPTSYHDAIRIAERIGDNQLKNFLLKVQAELGETPKELKNVRNYIILNNFKVLSRLANELSNSFILGSELQGEAVEAGKFIASIVNSIHDYKVPHKSPATLLLGGEPDVTVRGKGVGGRNSELGIGFITTVRKGVNYGLIAFATDGIDGNSDYAGVSLGDMWVDEVDVKDYLESSNTYAYFEVNNRCIKTGSTGTNVNNIYIVYIK
ncbi:glycerate kinase [Sulfolobales archaeon HS-7]|nr:glycerate kinase [Sulfolobales archaeon HS-7]